MTELFTTVQNSSDEELKFCPFCGGEPHLYVGLANGLTCRVKCESCGIMTEIGGKEVIDDWNRRVKE